LFIARHREGPGRAKEILLHRRKILQADILCCERKEITKRLEEMIKKKI